jgi:putative transposase
MTWPRYVPSESYCFVTRRCAQRKFLLKPSKAANRAFEYCLAWAAHKTGVQVLCSVVLSNHYHLGLYDPEGRVSEFMRELNRLVAKHHNTMYRRRENLFSSDKFSKVLLESAIDVVRRLVYTLDNPVKADLVDTARHWPGVISLPEHLATTKTVKRPPLFFRENGQMPKTLELTYHKPELFEHLDDDTYRDWVARMVATREALRRRQREEKGRKVLGRRAVLAQHHEDSPSSDEKPFAPNPRVGIADKWRRIEAIQRLVGFLKEYAECLRRWRAGNREVVFPYGTYAMRVFHGARCAQAPPAPA